MPYPAPRRPLAEPLEARTLFAAADGFTQSTFVDQLDRPTAMEFAPDGRLFVAEQGGAMRVVKGGGLLADPFVSLDVDDAGERGLLGVAFDPAFADNGFVYVYYTVPAEGAGAAHNRVSRFTAAGDAAAPGSEAVLLDLPPLSAATNHNGGAIHFGPDGKLYVGVGENNDATLAQPLDTPFGKLLRINPDGSIPADNPFAARTTGTSQAIFARGLRNPYTFAFDPATGRLHVNDVGQSTFEEVNLGQAGANYGWPIVEGKRTTQDRPDGYVDPLLAYGRSGGKVVGNAIAGGTFYRAPAAAADPFPAAFDGDYLFSDFGSGFVKSMDVATRKVADFASGLQGPVDLKVGPDGRVYALEYAGRVSAFAPAEGNLTAAVDAALPAAVVQGDRGRATVRVTNAGGAAVRGPVTVRLLESADDASDASDATLAEVTRTVRLKPGASKAFKLKFAYPAGVVGVVRLIGTVTGGDGVRESDPADNTGLSATTVNVAAAFVDLVPTIRPLGFAERPDGARAGLVVDVANLGNVRLDGTAVFHLQLVGAGAGATTAVGDPTVRLKVDPGKQKGVRIRFLTPVGMPLDNYSVRVDLESSGSIAESDLSNNSATSGETFRIVHRT